MGSILREGHFFIKTVLNVTTFWRLNNKLYISTHILAAIAYDTLGIVGYDTGQLDWRHFGNRHRAKGGLSVQQDFYKNILFLHKGEVFQYRFQHTLDDFRSHRTIVYGVKNETHSLLLLTHKLEMYTLRYGLARPLAC